MSDTMEVWRLCEHGEVHEHGFDFDSICGGGKRIVLRRIGKQKAGDVWVEVSDDE